MKYRTVIEIICEADNKDEACFLAGEYLRGKLDEGEIITAKAFPLRGFNALKYGFFSMVLMIVFSALVLCVTPIEGKDRNNRSTLLK
ncbi:MAG: hypothetical protein HQL30_00815 [Candidatus Omnitrophica bacterium]|nr:hypothetical protein [Candidatus Omnitrophota bacterium]